MQDFVDLFHGRMTRKQVRNIVDKLVKNKALTKQGTGRGTFYIVGENFKKSMEMMNQALELGLKQMKSNGDLKSD